MFRPTGFDPARKYPILNNIYPGPQSGSVSSRSFSASRRWDARAIAELGFVVVQIDGMALRWLLAWGAAPPLLVMDNLDYGVAEATGRARASFHTPLPPAGVSLAGALAALLALSRRPRGR